MTVTSIVGIGDPQVLAAGGKYYMYGTTSPTGFLVWESADLVSWEPRGMCFSAIESWGKDCFWAPEVVAHDGKFLMHYTARSRALNSKRIGVAVADSPLGPFRDVWDRPMFDFGWAAIDASVLRCPEGNFLYFSRDCGENIVDGVKTSQTWCVRLDDTLTKTVGEPAFMTGPTNPWERVSLNMPEPHLWNEGPCAVYEGGRYWLNFSVNWYASNDYAIGLAIADHPMGPWTKPANNPVFNRGNGLAGAGHNAFFRKPDGTLMTAFHVQADPEHPGSVRRAVIAEVKFGEKNGEPIEILS